MAEKYQFSAVPNSSIFARDCLPSIVCTFGAMLCAFLLQRFSTCVFRDCKSIGSSSGTVPAKQVRRKIRHPTIYEKKEGRRKEKLNLVETRIQSVRHEC